MSYMEVMELFNSLESNLPHEVEEVKHKFHEQFNNTRDSWLLYGMYDYFMSTGSQRAVEVLVAVREPHDKFLFDRLGLDLKSSNRLQALTLLGHVVKRQPTWLIKITNHYLLKELIKLLKSENEIITITSALLVLNVLLTVIPALISSFLPEIFEGFSRLAAWNTSQKNKVPEIHLFHLQISLYVLFVQLYSMYPCSFVIYLKQQYSATDNLVFTHTIKPMVETMRMHPSLIVSNKDNETSTNRWKKMEQHDVVMECTRYTLLENGERNYQNPSTWTNSGSSFSSALEVLKSSIGATGDIISVNSIRNKDLWSPMLCCGEFPKDGVKSIPTTPNIQSFYKTSIFNHNEHSPPEAAVEATPETTPIRDVIYQQPRLPSINSTVVRALNSFGLENLSRRNSSTPNSQPSSPLKKEGFVFPSEDIQSQALVRRMDRMLLERNQISESNKDNESNFRSESKPIAAQILPTVTPEIIQTGEEDVVECDQQSNGSPCQTYEGGLHMPDSNSLKEFVMSVRTRRRYHSQCTPEKTIHNAGQSTGSSPKKGPEFSSLSVRRANSCPEIKKTNGSSISSGTSPLQEETEDDHGDSTNVSNGHNSELPISDSKKENHVTNVRTVFTQTEHILPYEHLFYSIFPAYNDSHSSVKGQQNVVNSQEDKSLNLIEKYVRTSAIVLNHQHAAKSSEDVKLLKEQISLLTLQLQFERNRREVHAERNRRLLGKSRSSRALDEHNSALKDQVSTLQVELEHITSGFEQFRQDSLKQIQDLKDSASHWQTECLKYQEETKEAKNNYVSLEQLYNVERVKTAEVTKQLSETKAELFNTLSELSIVQAAADISKELKNTVTNLQRELVMSGEMQSRQRDIMTHVNALRYDAAYAMLSQESYKHNLSVLQESLYFKSALLDASNARIADLEQKLHTQNLCVQNEKSDTELLKEQFNKQLSELKEECRILKEIKCQYEENKEEEESKQRFEQFLKELPKFSSDVTMVDSQSFVTDQDAKFRLNMLLAEKNENCDVVPDVPTTPK